MKHAAPAASAVAFDPPEPKRPRRIRPVVSGSVAADVAEALRAEHERLGGPFGHALEVALRRAYNMPPPKP